MRYSREQTRVEEKDVQLHDLRERVNRAVGTSELVRHEFRGLELVSDDQWHFYQTAIAAARATGKPFALGGAFAWATYTGMFRNTKDMDIYVMREDREAFIEAMHGLGAVDYYDTHPYDRGWIYRSTKDGYIVDIIWDMANYVQPMDIDYVTKGVLLKIREEVVRVLPAEELLMNKLYIVQRGRCDYFDVFNLLYGVQGKLDWDRLIEKLGENKVLLASALGIFAWLCPGRVDQFPHDLWTQLAMARPDDSGPDYVPERVAWLDTRPWFIPALKPGEEIFVDR